MALVAPVITVRMQVGQPPPNLGLHTVREQAGLNNATVCVPKMCDTSGVRVSNFEHPQLLQGLRLRM